MKSRVFGIAILLLSSAALTGCEQACDIFVWNSSDEELLLYREPIDIGVTIKPSLSAFESQTPLQGACTRQHRNPSRLPQEGGR